MVVHTLIIIPIIQYHNCDYMFLSRKNVDKNSGCIKINQQLVYIVSRVLYLISSCVPKNQYKTVLPVVLSLIILSVAYTKRQIN